MIDKDKRNNTEQNNTDIGYLSHTVETIAEPAASPSLSALPNFAVNE